MNETKLIYSSQHGFTKGKSCLIKLIEFFDKIFEWYEQGDSLDIIYLVLARHLIKFHTKRLIKNLEDYGIQENVLRWIAKLLEDRK